MNLNSTMVIGLDVTYPSPGFSLNAPSIAGMLAIVDKDPGRWPAVLSVQKCCPKLVTELDSMLESRLELWKTQAKHLEYPENLLLIRDGVFEGRYSTVIQDELPRLRKACFDRYITPKEMKKDLPRIAIIVVGKRHHTRLYPTKTEDAVEYIPTL